ncbi:dioxygenase [Rhizohabitans arisaemae]|uniref:dioxygenase family protein n=1 Tax=Rhizohabitans arisaemae TaxID=2720610 RepID=UPI0024B11ED7|nr:dioxygenase [Rhizohabitans arisaemae]
MDAEKSGITRKTLLKAAIIAVPAGVLLSGQGPALAREVARAGALLTPTPYCDDDDDDTTPAQTEGPYFKSDSPRRTVLPGDGVPLTVTGYVLGRLGGPISGALLDFWQADAEGAYDNAGYDLRGHQFSDARGAFRLTTVVPGLYPGRTRHLHVKVQAPNGPVLTTQLYFPGEPGNDTDNIFHTELLMKVRDVGAAKEATFDFVLEVDGPRPASRT